MSNYRIDQNIYRTVSDGVADSLAAASQTVSEAVASAMPDVVLPQRFPEPQDQVATYRYSTTVTWRQVVDGDLDVVVQLVHSELSEMMKRFEPGTTVRPMRLAFIVPPLTDKDFVPEPDTQLVITAQVVWIRPPKQDAA